ncbi:alpha/beta hydrolase [Marinomonas epiphytica]
MNSTSNPTWQQVSEQQDFLGPLYCSRTFQFIGSRGRTTFNTLIHHTDNPSSTRAILYIHGYTDYFFQTELADFFIEQGYCFYAIDLQGYGRSLRPNLPPNWCESIDQYQQDIHIALATMKQDGIESTCILAHSTGGLVAANYLAYSEQTKANTADIAKVTGLILNSPFLALPFSPNRLRHLNKPITMLLNLLPFLSIQGKHPTLYAQTLHKSYGGQWDYRLDWKPAQGFPLSFAWLKQIHRAQQALKLASIQTPALLCHSSKSTIQAKNKHDMAQGDGVLDIDSMQAAARNSFANLATAVIEGGYHDLFLSPKGPRNAFLQAVSEWLKEQSTAQKNS